MKNLKIDENSSLEEIYNTYLQIMVLLADTQNVVGEIARGVGKTTVMMTKRLVRVSYDMPKSIILLTGPTYTFLLETVIPGILEHLAKNYIRGVHYEYGQAPPKHFKRPYTAVAKWNHTISFAWGTVVQFVSIDRPESAIGKNAVHVFNDEALRTRETDFLERIMPTLRGDRTKFGHSHYFRGLTMFSSSPNMENDHDWWLAYEENMDKQRIKEIQYVAYRVLQSKAKMEIYRERSETINEQRIDKLKRFVNRWQPRLREKRKGQYAYFKGSSFANLMVLSLDYIKDQFKGAASNVDKAKLSILNIRPKRVKDMFFSKFDKKNIFEDSYRYNNIDLYSIDGKYQKTSRDLKQYHDDQAILIGLDPGNFMSAVFAQERREAGKSSLTVFKNMYVITPYSHFELAQNIQAFFQYHKRKNIYLYYDRAGNQKQRRFKDNPKGDTDATILKRELQDLGWTVNLMSVDQKTIFYWQHYFLLNRILSERESNVPHLRICQNECEELISSIYMSGIKKTEDGGIELDKSAERKLEYKDQAYWSPQIATALMYLVYGKYDKWLPNSVNPTVNYEGL